MTTSKTTTRTVKSVKASKTTPTKELVSRRVKSKRSLTLKPKVKNNLIKLFSYVLVFGVGVASVVFYVNTKSSDTLNQNNNIQNNTSTNVSISNDIIKDISQIVYLPKEEVTYVVRVKDSNELKDQGEFYKNVKDGDYLVFYPSLAVIYDSYSKRVVSITSHSEQASVTGNSVNPLP